MTSRLKERKQRVTAKAMAHKDAIQLVWRAYQGLILAVIILLLTAK